MNKEADFNGSVVVVQPIEHGMVDKLNAQDGLYTLYLQGAHEGKAIEEHSIINSISRGINIVGEAVKHEVLGKFVREIIYNEIIPTLNLSEEELKYYAGVVLERFANPFVKHYLMSIALNSMSKYETRVLPSLLEYLQRKGELPKKLTFSLAALIEFYKGKRGEENIKLADDADVLDLYKTLWGNYDGTEQGLREIVTTVLGFEKNWKMDLNKVKGLNDAVTNYLINIEKVGIKEALEEVMV